MKYFVIAFLFVFVNIHAQKCRYLVNKVSGMDNSRLIITEPRSLCENFGDGDVNVWSTIYGDTSLVLAFVFESNENLLPLNKGDSIFVRLDNDEVQSFILKQNAVEKVEGKKNLLTALTIVDNDAIGILQKHLVEEIKVNFGEKSINGLVEKKDEPEAIRTVINCVVRHLQ
jgi:hypothetical protein